MLLISVYSLTCRGVAIAKTDEWFFSLRGSAKSAIKHEKHKITKRTHLSKWASKESLRLIISVRLAFKRKKNEITKRTHLSQWFDKVNGKEGTPISS
jgi:hypothetical protein